MSDERYNITTVECSRCKTKQKVHVTVCTVATQMGDESIRCLDFDKLFEAKLPDRIIRGPFPVWGGDQLREARPLNVLRNRYT